MINEEDIFTSEEQQLDLGSLDPRTVDLTLGGTTYSKVTLSVETANVDKNYRVYITFPNTTQKADLRVEDFIKNYNTIYPFHLNDVNRSGTIGRIWFKPSSIYAQELLQVLTDAQSQKEKIRAQTDLTLGDTSFKNVTLMFMPDYKDQNNNKMCVCFFDRSKAETTAQANLFVEKYHESFPDSDQESTPHLDLTTAGRICLKIKKGAYGHTLLTTLLATLEKEKKQSQESDKLKRQTIIPKQETSPLETAPIIDISLGGITFYGARLYRGTGLADGKPRLYVAFLDSALGTEDPVKDFAELFVARYKYAYPDLEKDLNRSSSIGQVWFSPDSNYGKILLQQFTEYKQKVDFLNEREKREENDSKSNSEAVAIQEKMQQFVQLFLSFNDEELSYKLYSVDLSNERGSAKQKYEFLRLTRQNFLKVNALGHIEVTINFAMMPAMESNSKRKYGGPSQYEIEQQRNAYIKNCEFMYQWFFKRYFNKYFNFERTPDSEGHFVCKMTGSLTTIQAAINALRTDKEECQSLALDLVRTYTAPWASWIYDSSAKEINGFIKAFLDVLKTMDAEKVKKELISSTQDSESNHTLEGLLLLCESVVVLDEADHKGTITITGTQKPISNIAMEERAIRLKAFFKEFFSRNACFIGRCDVNTNTIAVTVMDGKKERISQAITKLNSHEKFKKLQQNDDAPKDNDGEKKIASDILSSVLERQQDENNLVEYIKVFRMFNIEKIKDALKEKDVPSEKQQKLETILAFCKKYPQLISDKFTAFSVANIGFEVSDLEKRPQYSPKTHCQALIKLGPSKITYMNNFVLLRVDKTEIINALKLQSDPELQTFVKEIAQQKVLKA